MPFQRDQLFDEMPDAFVVIKSDTRRFSKSIPAAADLFNVSERDLVGKALSVFVCEDRALRGERTPRPEARLRGPAPETAASRTRAAVAERLQESLNAAGRSRA